MTTVMKASGSAEFLGLVPALAGFTPTRSIVLTPFEGKRTYGALRIDLPDGDPIAFAEGAVELVARVERTDALAVVVYTGEHAQPTGDGLVLPHGVVVEELLTAAEERRLGIVDALCVTPEGWASYLDDDPSLHSLDTIRPAPGAPGDDDVLGDQSAGAELPEVGVIAAERVARALVALEEAMCRIRDGRAHHAEREHPQAVAAAYLLDDIPALLEAAVGLSDDPPPYVCAALIWLLDRPLYRDVALLQWAGDLDDGHRALSAQLAHHDTGALPGDGVFDTMIGEGPRPSTRRLHAALRATRRLAALAPRSKRVGPLALAAWLSWALGRPSHSERYLAEVRAIAPDYSFGRLLNDLMIARPLPGWAFDRRIDDAA